MKDSHYSTRPSISEIRSRSYAPSPHTSSLHCALNTQHNIRTNRTTSTMAAAPIIGIDLGTTFSCVACYDTKTQKVEVIESASGRTMPSWVSFTPEGKLVGVAAKSQVASNPRNTVYDVKRIIGRSFTDPVVKEECKAFPFEVIEGGVHGEVSHCIFETT